MSRIKFNNREIDVLNILWDEDNSLSVNDIASFFLIKSSSGIYPGTKPNLSKSPKFSISLHANNDCCDTMAI